MFWLRYKKLIFSYALLSGGLTRLTKIAILLCYRRVVNVSVRRMLKEEGATPVSQVSLT